MTEQFHCISVCGCVPNKKPGQMKRLRLNNLNNLLVDDYTISYFPRINTVCNKYTKKKLGCGGIASRHPPTKQKYSCRLVNI